jgi:hypothetical protein
MRKKYVKKRDTRRKKSKTHYFFSHKMVFIFSCFSLLFILSALTLKHTVNAKVCANSISCIKDLSGKLTDDTTGIFMGKKIGIPQEVKQLADTWTNKQSVLGDATQPVSAKHIYVDLTNQKLYAFDGAKMVFNDDISSGRWHPTPEGTFRIWVKLRATRMTGGQGGDFYDLPNVPYTMFFYGANASQGQGFSLHGAYWHNNFGHPMSHGCVNMRITDGKALFDWGDPTTTGYTTYATDVDPGTLITIYGTPSFD